MNSELKCNCQFCNGHIAFPEDMAGQSISCPHCKLETLLYVPHWPTSTPKKRTRSKCYIGLIVFFFVFIVTACLILLIRPKAKDHLVETVPVQPIPEAVPDSTTTSNSAPEHGANQADDLQRRIDAAVQRATEHYNSASEVAYRREVETKLHFQHLERMNAIKSGATDLELEVMKLRHQEAIQAMESTHAIKEAEWQREESERR